MNRPFTFTQAQWIWSGVDTEYNDYRQVEHRFQVNAAELTAIRGAKSATLSITADSLYQVWLNGAIIGHGPAKSAKGRRSVDTYDVALGLRCGENVIEVAVLSIGVGTMCYVRDLPGIIFEIDLDRRVLAASGSDTRMRKDGRRRQGTVRRWITPCLEDFDAAAMSEAWSPATVVKRTVDLYPRRVPLPTREVRSPQRIVLAERIILPNVSVSFRHKPYLVSAEENLRQNHFGTKSLFVTDISSPIDQTLHLTPTRGAVTWYHAGKVVVHGKGWDPWQAGTKDLPRIELRAGLNRLIGIHRFDHFTEINLAGRCEAPVTFINPFGAGGFQVIAGEIVDAANLLPTPEFLPEPDWESLKSRMPTMDPRHTLIEANAQDLVLGAEVLGQESMAEVSVSASDPLLLSPAAQGTALRVVVDLGSVYNGWISFRVRGHKGSRLIVSCFEGIEAGPPLRLQWAYGCENAMTYRCGDGLDTFESFLPYGVRYLALHHTGDATLEVSQLHVLTANCGSRRLGSFNCSDPMLNRIYDMAVQTVISGLDDTITDCPTFEQVNWNFDNRAAWIGESRSCANTAVGWNSIVLFAEDPEMTGAVRSHYPSSWNHQIPTWPMHWIMWCRDYLNATGDVQRVTGLFPRIRAGIEEFLSRIGANGLMAWTDVWHFFEWGRGRDDDHAINTAEQAVLVATLDAGIELAIVAGEDGGRWREARQRLAEAIDRELWVPSRGAYADSLHADGTLSPISSQTTNAMVCTHGVASRERARELAHRIANNDPALLPYGSPYGLFHILELYDQLGLVEPLFATIRHRFGAMAQAGDSTLWEHFADYGHLGFPTRSRCHPFASYVIKFLVSNIGGIHPVSRGTSNCIIKPRPPQGVTFGQCGLPTPHGIVKVGWHLTGGEITINTDLPVGVTRLTDGLL